MASPPLSVIIPVFNEERTIDEVVRRVCSVDVAKQIIIVDDGSTDGTRDRLASIDGAADITVVRHERNRGKGAAIRTGLTRATGETVIIQDADLEYDPSDYHRLLAPIRDGRADVVYGSRFLTGQPHRVLYFWHFAGNRFVSLLSNVFTNLNLTDIETCYKLFRREIIQRIEIEEDGFGFEPEVTAKIARLGCRVYEVGISYSGRTYAEGKKIRKRDGLAALWCIVKYNLLRRGGVSRQPPETRAEG